jgi:hypothetical protein
MSKKRDKLRYYYNILVTPSLEDRLENSEYSDDEFYVEKREREFANDVYSKSATLNNYVYHRQSMTWLVKKQLNENTSIEGLECAKYLHDNLKTDVYPEVLVPHHTYIKNNKYYYKEDIEIPYQNFRSPWDMFIPLYKVLIEYDGNIFHSSYSNIKRDIKKTNLAIKKNYNVIRITDTYYKKNGLINVIEHIKSLENKFGTRKLFGDYRDIYKHEFKMKLPRQLQKLYGVINKYPAKSVGVTFFGLVSLLLYTYINMQI